MKFIKKSQKKLLKKTFNLKLIHVLQQLQV